MSKQIVESKINGKLLEIEQSLIMLCSENNKQELMVVQIKLLKKHIKRTYVNLTNKI